MPQIPGTGHPDGEARPMPHGEPLAFDTGASAPVGGLSIDNSGSYWPVAAYRSVAIVVRNSGAFPVSVTPEFGFYEGSSLLNTFPVQVVAAGATKRLLFQVEGELLIEVVIRGVGGTSTVGYYIVGSNLDPFSSAVKLLDLRGVNAGVQTIPVGAGGALCQFQETGTISYIPNPELFSFEYAAAGIINKVHILQEGLYGISAKLEWAAPLGAYVKQTVLTASNGDPVANNGTRSEIKVDTDEVWANLQSYFALSAAMATVGGNNVSLAASHANGVGVLVQSAHLQIVQFANTRP